MMMMNNPANVPCVLAMHPNYFLIKSFICKWDFRSEARTTNENEKIEQLISWKMGI